jgi:hypothetical protein
MDSFRGLVQTPPIGCGAGQARTPPGLRRGWRRITTWSAVGVSFLILIVQGSAPAKAVTLFSPPFASGHRFIWSQGQNQTYGGNLSVIQRPQVNLTTGDIAFGENASVRMRPYTPGGASFAGDIGVSRLNITLPAAGGHYRLNVTWNVMINVSLYSRTSPSGGGFAVADATIRLHMMLKYSTNGTVANHLVKRIYGKTLFNRSSSTTVNYSTITLSQNLSVPPTTAGISMDLSSWIFYRADADTVIHCSTTCGVIWATIEMGSPGLSTRLLGVSLS